MKTFSWPIIGHTKIKNFLQKSIFNQSMAHAYIFYGPSDVGKNLTAEYFSKSILCKAYQTEEVQLPCNTCESCKQFDKGLYADLFYVEREIDEKTNKKKQNITVQQIRELQKKINKRAFLNSFKIVIIKEAHTLNKEASNSLLKTLEEPTEKTILILITESKELLLPTIISRCQAFKFMPIKSTEIYDYLIQKSIDRTNALEISKLCLGRPTKAIEFANSLEKFTEFKQQNRDLLLFFDKNPVARFKFIEKISAKQPNLDDLCQKLNYLGALIRDIVFFQTYNQNLAVNFYLENQIKELAEQISLERANLLIKKIEQSKQLIRQNVNPRLVLENLII